MTWRIYKRAFLPFINHIPTLTLSFDSQQQKPARSCLSCKFRGSGYATQYLMCSYPDGVGYRRIR